ncbi:hybrid sensor histidine kinase/response regulator [Thermomonas sp. HDW16]|uniref:ATP-binding response regulator n=1 Tax=Thermomonas sp. HDW16 TaxID=2714945 RepID=UPI001409E8AE|nr:hybrid sensor histidine kinase/response regulator [Thermomonas sp. HDW16]QIL20909.1 HAMP domain-containing histidine kinase [Thermomonas sp. HDW16]
MEAMQQLALASGTAIGGGLFGAAVSAALRLRAQRRDALQAARLIANGSTPPLDASHPLSPLLEEIARQLAVLRRVNDDNDQQRRQLSAEMARLMTQADGAKRAKDRFLAAISHDLRQPLQSMGLTLEQLRRDAPPSQAGEIAQLDAGMRAIVHVLDGLSLLSQLEAGALQAHAAPCDLRNLFASIMASRSDATRRAGIALCAHAGDHAVYTDPDMLRGLLERLIDNAIKASKHGARVLLVARRHGGDVRIEVRDGGVGIAPIHQPRVFDEFFQVGNPERDHRKGLGLGLSIVSRFAALLGTRVELRSRLHAGACFWLTLPRASVLKRPPCAVLRDLDSPQREALAAMLRSWGYAVYADADVDTASALIGSGDEGIDAVLCAVDSDDDPAWALIRTTASHYPLAARIVLCTQPGAGLLEAASRHGARVLSHPPPPSKLRSLLARRTHQRMPGAA